MARPTPFLLLMLAAGLVQACATERYVATVPLYDFNTVFLNDDMGAQKPWKTPDRKAIAASLRDRRKAEAARRGSGHSSATRRRSRTDYVAPGPMASPPARSYSPSSTSAGSAAGSGRLAHVDAYGGSEFERPVAPKRTRGLVLGDGSVRSELVAAATRLVGLGPSMGPNSFLAHLQKSAAVKFAAGRKSPGGVAGTWLALQSRQLTYEPGQRASLPGDLVFFHHIADVDGDGRTDALSGVGVVEQVVDNETVVCIMPALGAVRRVPASPARASVRRDAGRVLNMPIRPRRPNAGPDRVSLSGQLVAGFARL